MSSPFFFWAFLQLPKLLHNCEDYFHFYCLSAVHMISIIYARLPDPPPKKKKTKKKKQQQQQLRAKI